MAVTEGNIPVGDTGLELDTAVVEQSDGTLAHREAVVIADPENNDNRLRVIEDRLGTLAIQVSELEVTSTIQHQRRMEELLEEIIIRLECL